MPDLVELRWRRGMQAGRTIYAMPDGVASRMGCDDPEKDKDVLIGVMDTQELAAEVVLAHNARCASRQRHPSSR